MTKYVPTGRPPGRPPKPAVEKLGIRDAVSLLRETTVDPRTRPMRSICPECFPGGWEALGVTPAAGLTTSRVCQHGVWVFRP